MISPARRVLNPCDTTPGVSSGADDSTSKPNKEFRLTGTHDSVDYNQMLDKMILGEDGTKDGVVSEDSLELS